MYFNTIYTILSNIKHFIPTNFARNYFLQALNYVPSSFFAVFIAKLSLKQGYKIAATSKGRLTLKFYALFHHKKILKTDCAEFFTVRLFPT